MSGKDWNGKRMKLLQYVNQFRVNGLFNDVVIKAGNESFPANRLILSCFSNVLEKMFLVEMKEKYQNTIEINEFDGKAVVKLLEYIYTGDIFINSENVVNLMSAANFLQLQEVTELCFGYLKDSISVENWATLFSALQLYENEPLLQQTFGFISENLNVILQKDEFKELKVNNLISIVQNLDRNVIKELSIYEAVMSWVKHDEENRKSEFQRLFQLVKLDKLPCEFLEDVVACDPLIRSNLECLNMVTSSIAQQFKQMRMRDSGSKLLRVGGVDTEDGEDGTKVEEIYNLFSKEYPNIPYNLFHCCALKFEDFIYCIGGSMDRESDLTTDRIVRMNIEDTQLRWEYLASMTERRGVVSAASFENYLVVAGGLGSQKTSLDSVEVFNLLSNKWQQISKLNQARCLHQLVACEGSLYALGGCNILVDTDKFFASMEKLSSLDGKWENAPSMNTPRAAFASVNCNGVVYAIGGRVDDNDEINILKSVEKFSPDENVWTFVEDMKHERESHAACVLRGKIYVVGGVDEDNDVVLTIECYDPEQGIWRSVGELEYGIVYHSLVAL